MKNFNKLLIALAGMALCASTANASLGFDTFKAARTYQVAAPQNIGWVATGGSVTNGPIDLVKTLGVGKIDFLTVTNTGTTGGTLTATLYGSSDNTNYVAISNYALVQTTTPDAISNFYYGGTNGIVVTNNVLLPGTVVIPNAATTGYATRYLSYYPFTNTGAITLTSSKLTQVGLSIDDQLRYLYVVYTPAGTVTNFTAGAVLTTVQFAQ